MGDGKGKMGRPTRNEECSSTERSRPRYHKEKRPKMSRKHPYTKKKRTKAPWRNFSAVPSLRRWKGKGKIRKPRDWRKSTEGRGPGARDFKKHKKDGSACGRTLQGQSNLTSEKAKRKGI